MHFIIIYIEILNASGKTNVASHTFRPGKLLESCTHVSVVCRFYDRTGVHGEYTTRDGRYSNIRTTWAAVTRLPIILLLLLL